ncbi:MAG: glycoside hydrolase family 3 N-terminal domain-containing protein [bacterium]
MKIYLILFISCSFFCLSCQRTHQNETYPREVEELLAEMTLEEKIGQMTMICLSETTRGRDKTLELDEKRFSEFITRNHIGSFLSATGSSGEWKRFIDHAQKINMDSSRLKIPLIFGIDHIHGANYVYEGTIFPHNLMLACSFDTALISTIANNTARETAGLGLLWNFAPVLDLGKNALWPRLYETFGEDPYLCSMMGKSYVNAYENFETTSGHSPAACLKHFIGYSDPRSGHDRSPAEIPGQIMHEMFLPPFRAAINAGVHSIMVNSGEVNGVPVHISEKYLKEMLREELGFEGIILTDIKDIQKVVEMHKAVSSLEEAVTLSVKAGIDISMSCNDVRFYEILLEKVREGEIPESRIDESVKKILNMKYELGLFNDAFPADDFRHTKGEEINDHRERAYEAAVKSQVLLKNNGILPLTTGSDILVSGFAAGSKKNLNGAWTFEWLGAEESRQPEDMQTLAEALENVWDGAIKYIDPDLKEFEENFLKASGEVDALVLTIGEEPYSEFKGNINDLSMPESHQRLCELAFTTGKPVILLLIEGRPRLLNGIEKYSDAIIFSGYPGIRGGEAIASILSGNENPSGKLAFSYPENFLNFSPYNSKITRDYEPLYPFGHGLSYTEFEYSDLELSDSIINEDQTIQLSIRVKNTGKREGEEVVLVFISDEHGKITRPRKELRRFLRVKLKPGEYQKLDFEIDPQKDLSYPDKNGKQILEPGTFMVYCGQLEEGFELK